MSFIDILKSLGQSGKERKEKIKQLDEDTRIAKLIEDRQKSSNQRELEKYIKEDQEAKIKIMLDKKRKERQKKIDFGHNPINAKNIMLDDGNSILKQKNIFKDNKNIFSDQEFIHKNNPKLAGGKI